jgi:hypothetical protein
MSCSINLGYSTEGKVCKGKVCLGPNRLNISSAVVVILSNGHSPANLSNSSTRRKFASLANSSTRQNGHFCHFGRTRYIRPTFANPFPRTRYICPTFANPFCRTRYIRPTFANHFPRTRYIRERQIYTNLANFANLASLANLASVD